MPAVAMNRNAILLSGKPEILLCSSLFYFRLPASCWEERMVQLRMCGYNCIDVYMPWNFHELRPGEWHFEGEHDVDAFLTLARKHGLYVVARPGPYICSEWDGGALPAWLYDGSTPLRQNDPAYLARLDEWLKRILPIVAAHAYDRGGSVVAVQLENEMDFFACHDPEGYMAHLRDVARACGVTVPLTACAGQCDPQGAGGTTPQVHITFNAYCPDDYRYLEMQLAHMRGLASATDTPLMITETDRAHQQLRREMMMGARLISPYNQVGGTDMDMTNGISNWAWNAEKPLALMATDYDFMSMITADGRLREEAAEGRLMGSMLASLGTHLAAAQPCDAPAEIEANFTMPLKQNDRGQDVPCWPAMRMDCGTLFALSNLGTEDGTACFASADGERCTVNVAQGRCVILPWQVSLGPWGAEDAVLLWSEAEWCGHEQREDGLWLTLTGDDAARAAFLCGGTRTVVQGSAWQRIRDGLMVRILPREEAVRWGCVNLPPLEMEIPSRVCTRQVTAVCRHDADIASLAEPLGRGITTMEQAGQYRGDMIYTLKIDGDDPLLLQHAADLLWARHGDSCQAMYSDGSSVLLAGGAGEWAIRVQSWGHANFDDVRQPALKMGSGKGISGAVQITHTKDIADLWRICPAAKYAVQGNSGLRETDGIMATGINSWSYPASPMEADYIRKVHFPENCDRHLLYIERDASQVEAYVDGALADVKRPGDPWLDLSRAAKPGQAAELMLRVTRRFSHDSLGAVRLMSGRAVCDAAMAGISPEEWQRLAPLGQGERTELPICLNPGEEVLLTALMDDGPRRDRMLVIEGEGIEATLLTDGHVAGRVLRPAPGYPEVKGGSARRIYLPGAWQENVRLHVAGIGQGGVLRELKWEMVVR